MRRLGELRCACCGAPSQASDLDRLLWCEPCVERASSKARVWGWRFGGLLALGLALWIYYGQQPSRIVAGGWIGVVVATLWLGSRLGRQVAFGLLRAGRSRRLP